MFIALHPQCALIGLCSLCIFCLVHSFTCSRKQFEVIGNYYFFSLQKMAHGGHKWMDMASNYSQDVVFKRDSVGTKEPKVSQEIFHDKIPASRAAPDLLIWGRMDPAFHVAFTLWVLSLCKLNIFLVRDERRLLLSPICVKVQGLKENRFLHISIITGGYSSCCCFDFRYEKALGQS